MAARPGNRPPQRPGARPPSFARFLETFEQETRLAGYGRDQLAIDTIAGEHIGTVMYYNGEAGDSAELGITIGDARRRGAGFGREAVVLFLRYLFAAHPFREIYLHTLEANVPARRAFAAAGFSPTVAVLRGADRYLRMEVRREWWLLWDMEGRFAFADPPLRRPAATTRRSRRCHPGNSRFITPGSGRASLPADLQGRARAPNGARCHAGR
ncbi:GNAT family N-acetyltransferase [Tepidiforma flava]|uniref:GNAT family N-acetyltransferase n=1 Tax=Tepidiforma flava TaxID=3004094 RepID=A0ABY7MC08_9CHLR|nr:GNAT family N-acetyltransferase [Tepidiforma flava]WBL37482.1 GNAT family N-acetyltransferase [Tepidiforma flava]